MNKKSSLTYEKIFDQLFFKSKQIKEITYEYSGPNMLLHKHQHQHDQLDEFTESIFIHG